MKIVLFVFSVVSIFLFQNCNKIHEFKSIDSNSSSEKSDPVVVCETSDQCSTDSGLDISPSERGVAKFHAISISNGYATIPGSNLGKLSVRVEEGKTVTLPLGNIPSCYYYTFQSLNAVNPGCKLDPATQIELSSDRKSVTLKNVNSSCDFVVATALSTHIPRGTMFSTTYQYPESLDLRVQSSWVSPGSNSKDNSNIEYCVKTKSGSANLFEEYSKCDVSECIWVDQMPTRATFPSNGDYSIFAFARLKSDISKVGGMYSSHYLSPYDGCPLYTHYEKLIDPNNPASSQCVPRFKVVGSTQLDFGTVNKADLSMYPQQDPYIHRSIQVVLETQSWTAGYVLHPLQSSRNFVGNCASFGFESICTIRFANSIKSSSLIGAISEKFKLYMIDPNDTVRSNFGIEINVSAVLK